jgi:hypothetical protein
MQRSPSYVRGGAAQVTSLPSWSEAKQRGKPARSGGNVDGRQDARSTNPEQANATAATARARRARIVFISMDPAIGGAIVNLRVHF